MKGTIKSPQTLTPTSERRRNIPTGTRDKATVL